jgi:hypothetical protein
VQILQHLIVPKEGNILISLGSGAGDFSFLHYVQTSLGSTQPPIQWVPGAFSLGVEKQEYNADHSPPPSAEVGMVEVQLQSSMRLHGVVPS